MEEKISALSTSSSSTRQAKARRPCKLSRWTRWSLRSRSSEPWSRVQVSTRWSTSPSSASSLSHDHLLLSASLKRLWWGRTKSGLVFTAGWLCSGFKSSGSTARVEGHQSLETKCTSLPGLVKKTIKLCALPRCFINFGFDAKFRWGNWALISSALNFWSIKLGELMWLSSENCRNIDDMKLHFPGPDLTDRPSVSLMEC